MRCQRIVQGSYAAMPPRKGFGLSLQLPPDSAAAPGHSDAGPACADSGGSGARNSLRVSGAAPLGAAPWGAALPLGRVLRWLGAAPAELCSGCSGRRHMRTQAAAIAADLQPAITTAATAPLPARPPRAPSGLLGGRQQRRGDAAEQVDHALPVQQRGHDQGREQAAAAAPLPGEARRRAARNDAAPWHAPAAALGQAPCRTRQQPSTHGQRSPGTPCPRACLQPKETAAPPPPLVSTGVRV